MSAVIRVPLSSVVLKTTGGGTPERDNPDLWNGGIPWASVKDFKDGIYRLTKTKEQISEKGLKRSASHLIPSGTPIICTRMAVGRIARANVPVAINQDLRALYIREEFDTDYVVWAVDAIRHRIENLSIGSTVKGISIKQLLSFEIEAPPVPEQTQIAEILSTVDRAIEQTEALIAKQQRLKTGLMQDLLTRGIDPHGNLRSEQTHPFKDSPLGRIPREWEVCTISSVLTQSPQNGYSPVESNVWNGTYMLGLGCLTVNGFQPKQLKYAPKKTTSIDAALLEPGDFLISRSNTRALVGLVGIFRDIGDPCIYSDLMVRLRFSNNVSPEYMEQVFMSPMIRRQIENMATGTSASMVKISGAIIKGLQFKKPSIEEQLRILKVLQTKSEALLKMNGNLAKLHSLKTGLMQDLLTGKKRVTALLNETEVTV